MADQVFQQGHRCRQVPFDEKTTGRPQIDRFVQVQAGWARPADELPAQECMRQVDEAQSDLNGAPQGCAADHRKPPHAEDGEVVAPTGEQAQVRRRNGRDNPKYESQFPRCIDNVGRPQVTARGQPFGLQQRHRVMSEVPDQFTEQHDPDGRMLPLGEFD